MVKNKCSGYRTRSSAPSIFPKTALKGLNFSKASATSMLPISPACQISSTSLKCSKTWGAKKLCVSERSPILTINSRCERRENENRVLKFTTFGGVRG